MCRADEILICRIGKEHLCAVAELEAQCFSEPWSAHALELLLTDGAIGFVALCEGRVAAYGGMIFAPDEGQITNVAVDPLFRRRGLGRAILDALLTAAREHGAMQVALEVRESNTAAIGLYRGADFVIAGRRKRFYRSPSEDALVMIREL